MIGVAVIRGLAEFHVLAGLQFRHGARLELSHRDTLFPGSGHASGVGAFLRGGVREECVVRILAGDEAHHHRGEFLPQQFGVVVLVQFPQAHQRIRHPRHAAQLARPERPEQMHDLRGRNPHQFQVRGEEDPLARVLLVEVVGRAPSGRIELDGRAHNVSLRRVGSGPRQVERQLLRFDQLELKRHAQTLAEVAVMPAREALAAFDHRPERERLETVDIGHPGGVRIVCPQGPQRLEFLLDRQRRVHRLRLDAGADGVAHPLIHGLRCPPILADDVA
jgi:hypothetical protein